MGMLTDQQREQIAALLVRRGYKEQRMRPGLFLEKSSDCFVDLNRFPYVSGVLAGAKETTANHGITRLYSLEKELNGILASKAPQPPAPSKPKDVTQVDNRAEVCQPSEGNCKPEQKPPAVEQKPAKIEKKPAKVKSMRENSFGSLYDKGLSREQLMERFGLNEREYERAVDSLNKIRGV